MIVWRLIRPPGLSAALHVRKNVLKYSAPTASSISIETIASYVSGHVAVVAQLDVDPAVETGGTDSLAGEVVLLARDRDRGHAAAALAGGKEREPTPTRPDLQDVIVRLKAGAIGDQPVLVALRVGQ